MKEAINQGAIWRENESILKEMTDDGIDMSKSYVVEHHFSGRDFALLEKLAVSLYAQGYEVTDAEEFRDERNRLTFCFDACVEMALSAEVLKEAQEKFLPLLDRFHCEYDGWGVSVEKSGEAGLIDDDDADDDQEDEETDPVKVIVPSL
ncbi:MAG: ribonuclease E inhibitor RraB [Succinivibrionaceae bacterium]|nr:ribonuclease E inhibitor RraB [Succinivibrionaceae bacterium]